MKLSKFFYITLFYLLLMAHLVAGIYYNGYRWDWLLWTTLGYVLLVIGGSLRIGWNFFFDSVNHLPLTVAQIKHPSKRVMLSFNGGPGGHTAEVLDILQQKSVRALFFVNGMDTKAHPGLIKRMYDDGHLIGNGTFFHVRNFPFKSMFKMIVEIEETGAVIAAITGEPPVYFRPPFGVCNPVIGRAIKATGLKSVGWNINSHDLRRDGGREICDHVLRQIRPNAIILFHERSLSTIAALPDLIDKLKERDYHFEVLET